MIANFGVVKDALVGLDVVAVQRHQRVRRQVLHAAVSQHFKGLFNDWQIVFRQRARVGARVGQRLVPLVQALRNLQRGFGRKAKLAIGLALQRCQVKQLARRLGGGLAFFCHGGGLAAHRLGNRQSLALRPDAVGFQFGIGLGVVSVCHRLLPRRVKPLGRVLPCFGQK